MIKRTGNFSDLEVIVSELVRVLLDEGGVSGGHLEVGGGAHAPVRLQQLLLRLVQLVLQQKDKYREF